MDHRQLDERLAGLRQGLVILARHDSGPASEGSLDHPAIRQEARSLHVIHPPDDLQSPAAPLTQVADHSTAPHAAAVGPGQPQPAEAVPPPLRSSLAPSRSSI